MHIVHDSIHNLTAVTIVSGRQNICTACYYAITRLSVRPFVTRVNQSKKRLVKIMQFSPYSSPVPLVFSRPY